MKKVAFYTLGCKLNFSETSSISRLFEDRGYQKVSFTDSPDIFIINTCSVTENADKKCKKVVNEARRISPHAYITIMGCYAQLKPKEIAEIPGVDSVLGAAEKFRLFDYLGNFEKTGETQVYASKISEANEFFQAHSLGDRTRTFLKVQDGCNYNCAFCTIPLARGRSRSNSIDDILRQVKELARKEVKEIVLTGVNIGDFGIQNGRRVERFIDLITDLDEVSGIERFRISSIEPNLLSDDIIEFVGNSKRFVPHFHIPLQSGSDHVLSLMQRRYLTKLYSERIAHIKSIMPDACIGVDVITGFPGETEPEFMKTYEFLNALPVSYLHVFTYSERANTRALKYGDIVPQKVRQKRSTMLRSLSEKKKRFFYESQHQSNRKVLFEYDVQEGRMLGFTENYIRVSAPYDPMMVNTVVPVKLKNLNPEGIYDVEEIYSLV
jgi:threonylcarbamoyladenosine tRNA methylthiotransferase MtaB